MRRSVLKSVLGQVGGLLFYLAGMVLFLFVMLDVFRSPPTNSIENLSAEHMGPLLLSVILIVTGRAISWKFGGDFTMTAVYHGASLRSGPQESRLEQLGYNLPPEESENRRSSFGYDDGEVYVVCSECGTRNETGYSYCSNCSAELPE